MNIPNTTEAQIATSFLGSNILASDANAAVERILPHLDSPTSLEYVAAPNAKIASGTLLQSAQENPFTATPMAVFDSMNLSISDIPKEWSSYYANWLDRRRRRIEFTRIALILEYGGPQGLINVTDAIVAGLLLYQSSAQLEPDVRKRILEVALRHPAGAWMAAEGLHHPEEREEMIASVSGDSRLLFWISQIPGFGNGAVQFARSRFDLFAGLVMALNGSVQDFKHWLQMAAKAGCEQADAAAACLVLQPNADDKTVWLSILKNPQHARYAYETVSLAKHTWSAKEWNLLKESLRKYAVSDNSQWACHWFAMIEPQQAGAALGNENFDMLWAAELVAALPNIDDYALRFQLGERLNATGSSPAATVLSFLNRRLARKANGTAL